MKLRNFSAALSNDRILSAHSREVTFSYRDRKNHDRKKTMTLDTHEFIRRFLLHVIPKRFVRVRHSGVLANRSKSLLSKCPPRPWSRCAQAPQKISSRTDARTHRYRYHAMPSMPKGNSGLACRTARPRTMGFFVMIAQRINGHVFPALCNSANASVRLLSSFYLSWPVLNSDVLASGSHGSTRMRPARHTITRTAMFARRAAMVTIPIGNRRCFTQRFTPTGFILNASDSHCSCPIVLRSHSG
jgi:hypothetical protein